MSGKALVIDANILIRAVLGRRVRDLLFTHAGTVCFYAPDVAYADARQYLPGLLIRRGVDPAAAMAVLDQLEIIVRCVDAELYETAKTEALRRIESRDADDWPVLACAMLLDCPVWTEDADFFGTGVATWTSDRVELYLTATTNQG
jgi:predicted nucleic acid-binding protein